MPTSNHRDDDEPVVLPANGRGPRCTICAHEKRKVIDIALRASVPVTQVARTHGVSRPALDRHKRNHVQVVPEDHAKAREDEQDLKRWFQRYLALFSHAAEVLQKAADEKDPRLRLAASAEARRVADSFMRAMGHGGDGTTINIHQKIEFSQQWIAIRGAVMNALRPFPDARSAVVAALAEVEDALADA